MADDFKKPRRIPRLSKATLLSLAPGIMGLAGSPVVMAARALDEAATDAACWARKQNRNKLPASEWVKRLKQMAIQRAQERGRSTREWLEIIVNEQIQYWVETQRNTRR